MLMPYPGNKLFDSCVERGLIPDKAAYYANIDREYFNMTAMPDAMWGQWVNFFNMLEKSWLWVKDTNALSIEKEDYSDPVVANRESDIYLIKAQCPYCGEEIEYREMIGRTLGDWPLFLGVGCTKCNKRIKVNLKTALKAKVEAEANICLEKLSAAEKLVNTGNAYVCECDAGEWREKKNKSRLL